MSDPTVRVSSGDAELNGTAGISSRAAAFLFLGPLPGETGCVRQTQSSYRARTLPCSGLSHARAREKERGGEREELLTDKLSLNLESL